MLQKPFEVPWGRHFTRDRVKFIFLYLWEISLNPSWITKPGWKWLKQLHFERSPPGTLNKGFFADRKGKCAGCSFLTKIVFVWHCITFWNNIKCNKQNCKFSPGQTQILVEIYIIWHKMYFDVNWRIWHQVNLVDLGV